MEEPPKTDKLDKWLSENEVIDILINCRNQTTGRADLRYFFNVVSSPIEIDEFYEYQGVYVARCILREKMGFDRGSKPGDFDVILIPFSANNIYFDRTAVYEIKIVRPTRKNIKRSPNSMGISQIRGLIADGFPFVSLMHVCMTEPLKESERMLMKFCTLDANSGEKMEPGKTIEDYFVDFKPDLFSWWSADNQMKRLISQDIPKYVGLTAFGLDVHPDSYSLNTCSRNLSHFESGYFNPHQTIETVAKIRRHFENFPAEYKRILFERNY